MGEPAAELTYRASDHTYRVGDQELIALTDVLEEEGLIDTRFYTEEGKVRGTMVHAATKWLDTEGAYNVDKMPEKWRGYVDAWERFKGETSFVSDLVEYKTCNQSLGLACRIDRVGRFTVENTMTGMDGPHSPISKCPEGATRDRWLIELKTGDAASWHWLQLAGQRECVDFTCQVGVVYLKPDGGYTFYRREYGQHLRDRQDFKAALRMVHWKRENA